MNQQHLIKCPQCNTELDKRSIEDGELIEKRCSVCKKDWILKVKIELIPFVEYEKE